MCRSYRTLTFLAAFLAIRSDNNQSSFLSYMVNQVRLVRSVYTVPWAVPPDINGGNVFIGVVTCVYKSVSACTHL